jgi:hypothetical protein
MEDFFWLHFTQYLTLGQSVASGKMDEGGGDIISIELKAHGKL